MAMPSASKSFSEVPKLVSLVFCVSLFSAAFLAFALWAEFSKDDFLLKDELTANDFLFGLGQNSAAGNTSTQLSPLIPGGNSSTQANVSLSSSAETKSESESASLPTEVMQFLNSHKTKMREIARTVCDELYCKSQVPRIVIPAHHKTGHVLSHALGRVAKDYCNCYREVVMANIVSNSEGGANTPKYKAFVQSELIPNGVTVLHFNRQPVSTVVSGYIYHSLDSTHEHIGTQPIRTMEYNSVRLTMQFAGKNEKLIRRKEAKKAKGKKQRLDPRLETVWNNIIDKSALIENGLVDASVRVQIDTHWAQTECLFSALPTAFPFLREVPRNDSYFVEIGRVIEKLKKSQNIGIREIYKKWPVRDGLIVELLRYFNCEMPHGLLAHLTEQRFIEMTSTMLGLKNVTSSKKSSAIEFDLGFTKFEKISRGFADALNMRVTAENEKRVESLARTHKVDSGTLIAAARHSLRENLASKCDITRIRASKDKHSTHKKQPPGPFRQQLVSISPGICQLLKRLTLAMDFPWLYSDVC